MDLKVIDKIKEEFGAGLSDRVPSSSEEVAEVALDDEVVGEVEDADVRMLLILAAALVRVVAETIVKARYEEIPEKKDRYIRKIAELRAKEEALNKMFWVTIRDEFCLWGSGSIGIRKGWKVVVIKDEEPSIEDIIKKIDGRVIKLG